MKNHTYKLIYKDESGIHVILYDDEMLENSELPNNIIAFSQLS